jgi:hypothetical protein
MIVTYANPKQYGPAVKTMAMVDIPSRSMLKILLRSPVENNKTYSYMDFKNCTQLDNLSSIVIVNLEESYPARDKTTK